MKSYKKMRHLFANKPKITEEDRRKRSEMEDQLQQIRFSSEGREVTAEVDSQYAYATGMRSDICQVRWDKLQQMRPLQ